jgi:hypothetical protein
MSVSCECCVLSGRGLCDELITRPEESYRLRCVVVCDLEMSWMRRPWPSGGCRARNKQTNLTKVQIMELTSVKFLYPAIIFTYVCQIFSSQVCSLCFSKYIHRHCQCTPIQPSANCRICEHQSRHTIIHVHEPSSAINSLLVTGRSIHALCRSRTSPQSTTRSPEIRADR